jgi:DNA repair protein RecO (recombination protein O)
LTHICFITILPARKKTFRTRRIIQMQIKTDGLVIRDLNVGEADRIVTILTRKKGVVRASARGARIVKSRISPATALLSHTDFTLFQGRDKYIIDEAEPLDFFMGLRRDLDKLALAQYIAELEGFIAPQEAEAEIYLRIALNALHLIDAGLRPLPLIKAAVEMRLLTIAGYMPELVACRGCGAFEADVMYLEPGSASIICSDCPKEPGERYPLSRGAMAALRHTVYADFERLFSFSLPAQPLEELVTASERYLLHCLERSFTTLEFYNGLAGEPLV